MIYLRRVRRACVYTAVYVLPLKVPIRKGDGKEKRERERERKIIYVYGIRGWKSRRISLWIIFGRPLAGAGAFKTA